MPVIILFIVMALAVSGFGNLFRKESESATKTPVSAPAQRSYDVTIPKKTSDQQPKQVSPTPQISVDTFLRYGPLPGEVFEETNQVVFEFGAVIEPKDAKGTLYFETKMEGLDEDWKKTYSKERKYTLPPGPKEYIFWVRAGIQDSVDPTPVSRTFKINISPYFKKADISSFKPPTFYTPSLIKLSVSLSSKEELKITGWRIEGKRGAFTIPKGVNKYDSNNPNFTEDIYVKNGDKVYISSAASPFIGNNLSFRPNKCLGYLEKSFNFTIAISQNCPRPQTDRLPRNLSEDCLSYIQDRNRCESLESDKLEKWDIFKDSTCMDYINLNFTYPGCFRNYSQDQDFLTKEWHIYMNVSGPEREIMDFVHDTIYLKDQNGLFIDKYKY